MKAPSAPAAIDFTYTAWLRAVLPRCAPPMALATTWGYIAQSQAAPAHALLDRIVAILWPLTHPKR